MAAKSIFESLTHPGSIGNEESNHFMLYLLLIELL